MCVLLRVNFFLCVCVCACACTCVCTGMDMGVAYRAGVNITVYRFFQAGGCRRWQMPGVTRKMIGDALKTIP